MASGSGHFLPLDVRWEKHCPNICYRNPPIMASLLERRDPSQPKALRPVHLPFSVR